MPSRTLSGRRIHEHDVCLISLSRAVPVQRLRHQVQEGGAARGGDGGHGPSSGRVRLRRAAGAVRVRAGREAGARRRALLRRGGVPVRRRRRRGRRRGAVPRVAAERCRAGSGAGARVRGLAGAGGEEDVRALLSSSPNGFGLFHFFLSNKIQS